MMDKKDNLLKNIAKNVRQRRHQFGFSQEELADLAGVHRTYIGMIERAEKNITLSSLSKLASALKCDLSSFFQEEIPCDFSDNRSYRLINFSVRGDYQGSLVPIEGNQDIPFEIKRVYYIWGTNHDAVRGHHAHRRLEQIIIPIAGSCDFILDDGKKRETIHLFSPNQGLYIKHNIWREFTNFSPDCVILVLASEHYDEADYIRDYEQFKKEVSK